MKCQLGCPKLDLLQTIYVTITSQTQRNTRIYGTSLWETCKCVF